MKLEGRLADALAALETEAAARPLAAAQQQAVATTLRYYRANAAFMHYDQYLARGWPIGTGVVEGACGHLVKDWMEQAGMRWTKDGAQAILAPRAVRLTDQWDAYWAFHRQRQHQRRHGPSATPSAPPEALALASAAAA
jgi:hypothetical protein